MAADARVHVEWSASDDFGLGDLTLVVKPPAGEEERRPLRSLAPARRDSGAFELDLAPLRLAEGEKLLYWLEVRDNDTVSGPKRAASATRAVKIYSEAEHHQRLLAEARRHWEEMVRLLGDRMEQLPRGSPPDLGRVTKGLVLDGRTRQLHERMREAARAMRKEKAAPRELSAALANVAQGIRDREVMVTSARQALSRQLQSAVPATLRRDATGGRARRRARSGAGEGRPLSGAALRQAAGRGPGPNGEGPGLAAPGAGDPAREVQAGAQRAGEEGAARRGVASARPDAGDAPADVGAGPRRLRLPHERGGHGGGREGKGPRPGHEAGRADAGPGRRRRGHARARRDGERAPGHARPRWSGPPAAPTSAPPRSPGRSGSSRRIWNRWSGSRRRWRGRPRRCAASIARPSRSGCAGPSRPSDASRGWPGGPRRSFASPAPGPRRAPRTTSPRPASGSTT